MIVLGIDPGVATVGFGLVASERNKLSLITYGTIRTPAGLPLPRRLLLISEDLNKLFDKFSPDHVAVEELFFSKNVTTGLAVAHGRGVILMTLARRDVPVFSYKPMQVKQGVVGYGGADKQQVMALVRMLLAMDKDPRPDDAADALAVAVCHAHSAGSLLMQK